MGEEKIEVLVEGGKASAGPPIGSTLGPLGVNIGEVVGSINTKTAEFKGMKVPVKIIIKEDKTFDIEVGTPPASQLIKKELNLEKGSGLPNKDKVGNIAIEQVIKVAKMKQDNLFSKDLKGAVKTIIGSCASMGLLVEGKQVNQINQDIDNGIYDNLINEGKTEVDEAKKAILKRQLESTQKELAIELEKEKAAQEAEKAKEEAKKAEVAEEGKEEEKVEEGKEEETEEKKEEDKEEKKEEKK